jgi:hypothetical protein
MSMAKDILIYGTGRYGILTALNLEQKGIKIKGFLDKNTSLIKTRLGLPVLDLNQDNLNSYIIIALENITAIAEVVKLLEQRGLKRKEDFDVSLIYDELINTQDIFDILLDLKNQEFKNMIINSYQENKNKRNGVVYTCLIDNYDCLIKHNYIDFDYDYICFTNNEYLINVESYGVWKFKQLAYDKLDNKRNSGWHKTHPHLLFPKYEKSIWIDANIDVRNNYLFQIHNSHKTISMPIHFERNCIYDECKVVAQSGLDDRETIDKMISFLDLNNFPKNYGLHETNIIYRNHNDIKIQKIDEEWWNFIKEYSKRDQCSLSYVFWKNEIMIENTSFPNARSDSNFIFHKHLQIRHSEINARACP